MNERRVRKLVIELSGWGKAVATQLRTQGVHIPGHATASLERTRRAIQQLSAAGIMTPKEHDRADRKFLKLLAKVAEDYTGQRYE